MTEISLMTIRKSDPSFLLQFASSFSYCIFLRKEELTIYQILILYLLYVMLILYYDDDDADADDACRQII